MAKAGFKITGEWKRFGLRIDPALFNARMTRATRSATRANALHVRREIRKRIRGNRYTKNAPLTILIKNSRKPLVDDADLFNAITTHEVKPSEVFVGVLRSSHPDLVNLGFHLHEGVTIPVSKKMRGMFYVLWRVSIGEMAEDKLEGRALELWQRLGGRAASFKPLKASTKVIVIPPRKFLEEVFTDIGVINACRKRWVDAIQQALTTP